uniref:Aminopeptidase O (putative) n=2 Tax=Sus scrofa TaxID=9823 RepID=A0A8D1MAU3_PIG
MAIWTLRFLTRRESSGWPQGCGRFSRSALFPASGQHFYSHRGQETFSRTPEQPAGPLQRERQAGEECGLARQVSAEVEKWVRVNRRPRKRKRRETEEVFAKLLPDQLLLLLEHLLEQTTLNPRTLQRLERTYHLPEQDAEVRHRWCELVVKHKYKKAYGHVERFLQEDQAMGIYLYGELMVNEDARQQQLARKCFELSKEQMDRSSAEVVAEMLF